MWFVTFRSRLPAFSQPRPRSRPTSRLALARRGARHLDCATRAMLVWRSDRRSRACVRHGRPQCARRSRPIPDVTVPSLGCIDEHGPESARRVAEGDSDGDGRGPRHDLSDAHAGKVLLSALTCGYAGAIGYPVCRYPRVGSRNRRRRRAGERVALGKLDEVLRKRGQDSARTRVRQQAPAVLLRNWPNAVSSRLRRARCRQPRCTVAIQCRSNGRSRARVTAGNTIPPRKERRRPPPAPLRKPRVRRRSR